MKGLIAGLFVVCLGIAPSGFADPVTLTSGFMNLAAAWQARRWRRAN